MANKRIELEQYRCYVDLIEENPPRKTVRRGQTIVMVTGIVLVVMMFILGVLSTDLTKNPRNVLEKPPKKAPATEQPTMPGSTPGMPGSIPGMPGSTPGMPNIPGGQQLPPGVPSPPGGKAPTATKGAQGAGQAQPTVTIPGSGPDVAPGQSASMPGQSAVQPDQSGTQGKKKKKTGPGKETKGAGNLANLANKVSGRGFQLYLLVLSVLLAIFLFIALNRARKEGKTK